MTHAEESLSTRDIASPPAEEERLRDGTDDTGPAGATTDDAPLLPESQGAELAIHGIQSNITKLVQDSMAAAEEVRKAQESAKKSEGEARKSEEEAKKLLEISQGLVDDIRGTRSQARSLLESSRLESIGKAPESAPLSPEQVERLVELKLLKSFRGTLPPEQYAKLQSQFKSDAVLRRDRA